MKEWENLQTTKVVETVEVGRAEEVVVFKAALNKLEMYELCAALLISVAMAMIVEVAFVMTAVDVMFTVVGVMVGNSVVVVVVMPERTTDVSVTVSVDVGVAGKAGRVRVVVRPSELVGC